MQEQHDHDRARPVGVQAAQKRAGGHFLHDVSDGRVRVIGCRRVVKRKKYSGDSLRDKKKEQDRAENIGPARAARDRLVERFVHQRPDAGPAIEPVIDALPPAGRFVRFPVRRLAHQPCSIPFRRALPWSE